MKAATLALEKSLATVTGKLESVESAKTSEKKRLEKQVLSLEKQVEGLTTMNASIAKEVILFPNTPILTKFQLETLSKETSGVNVVEAHAALEKSLADVKSKLESVESAKTSEKT